MKQRDRLGGSFKRENNIKMFLREIECNDTDSTQYCAGGKIETNEMGRACGAYGGG